MGDEHKKICNNAIMQYSFRQLCHVLFPGEQAETIRRSSCHYALLADEQIIASVTLKSHNHGTVY